MGGYGTEISGCGRFMKFSLFVANFLIFLGGLVIVVLCCVALVGKIPQIEELAGNSSLTGNVYILLIGGVIAALIAFFGCVGASREIKCMLLTYSIIILLLFITILVGGVLAYVYRDKLLSTMEREMKTSLRFYDNKQSVRDAWTAAQSTLHCCGVNGPRDWESQGLSIPQSCCREISPGQYMHCNTGEDTINGSNGYLEGCLNAAKIYLQKHASIVGGAGIALACLMLFGIIFSCSLFKMIE